MYDISNKMPGNVLRIQKTACVYHLWLFCLRVGNLEVITVGCSVLIGVSSIVFWFYIGIYKSDLTSGVGDV